MIIKFPNSASPAAAAAIVRERGNYGFPLHILDDLPFVDPGPPPRSDGRPRFSSRNCWNDVPTDSGKDDFARGERYAQMTIALMQAHSEEYGGHKLALSISAIDLERIIESMIRDGVARLAKGGKHSRTPVTSAMSGFLFWLTRYIAGIRD
jgi:hypothetical protein